MLDRKIIEFSWKELEIGFSRMFKGDSNIIFDANQKSEYFQRFNNSYDQIRNKYMKSDVEFLDRHKVAALIISTAIECGIVKPLKVEENFIFIGLEKLALSVGLSYMQTSLNKELRARSIKPEVKKFILPHALSCNTDYFDILSRNLYYVSSDRKNTLGFKLNVLDLANTLFLIEYITLLRLGIDPDQLSSFTN